MSLCRCRFRHIVRVNCIRGSSKNLFGHKTNWDASRSSEFTTLSTCPRPAPLWLHIDTRKNSFVVNQTNMYETSVSCHFSCFRAEYFFEFTVSFSRQRSSAHTVRQQTPRAIARIANLFETDYKAVFTWEISTRVEFSPGWKSVRQTKEVRVYMKTVDPGQILICRQKSTSTVLYGHVNPLARNLHLQCCSNLARDTHRSTFVRFSWPGLISTLPLGGGLKSTRGEISTRVKRNASCKRAIHFVHMAGWNLTRVETLHVNTA